MDWTDESLRAWQREHPGLELGLLLPLLRLESLVPAFEAFQRGVLEPFELTPSDYRVLTAVARVARPEARSPSQLARHLGHTTGGMTKMLRRLEEKGLVERRADPESRRGTRIELSPRGEATWERALRAYAAAGERRIATLSARERDEVAAALATLGTLFGVGARPR